MRAVLLFTLLLAVFWDTHAQEVRTMTLDECINFALANNEQLEIAVLENDIARTQISEALSAGLPQVNGNVNVQKNIQIQTSFIQDFISPAVYGVLIQEGLLVDPTIPAPQTFPAAFGTNYFGQASVSVSQLIFNGSYFVGLKAARTVKELSEKKQRQTEVEIVRNVSNAYYLVLIAQENLEFLATNFGTIDTLLNETQLMYENGFAEKMDVSRIKIQHNNLRTNLLNSTELLLTSINVLKFQMGMPLNEPIKLAGDLESIQLEQLEESQDLAYSNRPEYEVLQTNKKLAELNVMNFRSMYFPNIYANYNLGWTSGTNTFSDLSRFNNETWFKYSNIGVTLSIPIFDGLYKRSMIQRSKVQMLQIDAGLSQLENNISREISEAKIKLSNAKRSLEAQTENVELAQEVYNSTKIKYQEGVGPNLEVIEANNALKEAQTNYLNAVYDAISAQIELRKAQGTLYQSTN
jgi:outer membrane protein TolC